MPLKKAVKLRVSSGDHELAIIKERRASLRKDELGRELNRGILNENKRNNVGARREAMMKVKMGILGEEEVQVAQQTFNRHVDGRDYEVSKIVEEAVKTAKQEYDKNISAHAEAIDRFIEIYGGRLEELEERYRNNLEFLVTSYMKDREGIEERQNDDELFIQTVIFTSEKSNEQVASDGRGRIIAKVDMQNEINDSLRRGASVLIEAEITDHWNELRKVLEDYESVTKQRRRAYQALKTKDNRERGIIESQVLTTGTLFQSIRNFKEKMLHFEATNDKRISQINAQHKFFHDSYQTAKEQFISEEKKGKSRMIFLTKEFNSTMSRFNKLIEKAEKMLLLVHECSKYETEDEKILQPSIDEKPPPPIEEKTVMDDFRGLEIFWKRVGAVKIIATELELERARLAEESIILREKLRQCLLERNIC